jgi:hypothetical protein
MTLPAIPSDVERLQTVFDKQDSQIEWSKQDSTRLC